MSMVSQTPLSMLLLHHLYHRIPAVKFLTSWKKKSKEFLIHNTNNQKDPNACRHQMKNWFTQMIKSLSKPILPSSDTKGKNVTAILQMERCYKHYWSNKDSQFSSKIKDRTIQSMCAEICKQLLPWYQSQLSLITIAEIIASFTIIVWFGDQQIQPTANLLMAIHMEFL